MELGKKFLAEGEAGARSVPRIFSHLLEVEKDDLDFPGSPKTPSVPPGKHRNSYHFFRQRLGWF